jgi:hypothetical protein
VSYFTTNSCFTTNRCKILQQLALKNFRTEETCASAAREKLMDDCKDGLRYKKVKTLSSQIKLKTSLTNQFKDFLAKQYAESSSKGCQTCNA